MKFKALEVVNDCRIACRELDEAEKENNKRLIRIRWFTCLALLRSVGHVLEKVDQKSYSEYDMIFKEKFNSFKNDSIYLNFIKNDRDLILKEYKFFIIEGESERIESNFIVINDEGDFLGIGGGKILKVADDKIIKRFFKKGEGFDKYNLLHEIVSDAIIWWQRYIDSIIIEINRR